MKGEITDFFYYFECKANIAILELIEHLIQLCLFSCSVRWVLFNLELEIWLRSKS